MTLPKTICLPQATVGGITEDNTTEVQLAGADLVEVIRGIPQAESPE